MEPVTPVRVEYLPGFLKAEVDGDSAIFLNIMYRGEAFSTEHTELRTAVWNVMKTLTPAITREVKEFFRSYGFANLFVAVSERQGVIAEYGVGRLTQGVDGAHKSDTVFLSISPRYFESKPPFVGSCNAFCCALTALVLNARGADLKEVAAHNLAEIAEESSSLGMPLHPKFVQGRGNWP